MAPALFSRIHFGTLVGALILFVLPWTNVECAGRKVATQTGLQVMYGGATPLGDFADDDQPSPDTAKAKDSVGVGLIMTVAFVILLAAAIAATLVEFKGWTAPAPLGLAATAVLVLMLLQCLVGFPIDRAAKAETRKMGGDSAASAREMAELGSPPAGFDESPFARATPKRRRSSESDDFGRSMSAAMGIATERTGWFYLELLMLAVPAGIYINGKLPGKYQLSAQLIQSKLRPQPVPQPVVAAPMTTPPPNTANPQSDLPPPV